ncbi:MAG: glycoside hydrolase family 31 protein [Deltaproteobacteria bacterium]|nr:glycoside hydrolase family 31 protein [Deltaproteobacteria bacterium]
MTIDDLVVSASSDGAFDLRVNARSLLASRGGPVAARSYTEIIEALLGSWTFRRGNVREQRPRTGATLARDGNAIVLQTRSEDASVSTLRFERTSPAEVTVRASIRASAPFQSMVMRFACTEESHFLGFGEQYNALDHRGRKFSLFVTEQGIGRDPTRQHLFSGNPTTTYFPVPFFIDPRGFALAVDTDTRVEADLCATVADEYALTTDETTETVLRLFVGPTIVDVMRDWTTLQGRTSAPPAWAVDGVWLASQGGTDNARSVATRALAANIPVAAIWSQDWVGRREFGMGNTGVRYRWAWDESYYPGLPTLIRDLHAMNIRFFGYMNPFIVPEQDLWADAVARGYVPLDSAGRPYVFTISVLEGTVVDLTNPAAVSWYQGFVRSARTLGLDGWMQDFGEWLPIDARLSDGRDARRFHNQYPAAWQRAAREELEREAPSRDWVLLSRSGWLRTSRVSQVVWAGDQEANFSPWDGLPTVIPAMISLGLSGVGYVTHDIAGFSGGPSTAELYQRWTELGAFTPIMRTHEGLRRAENWNWDRDASTTAHFSRFARIHQLLAPRIRELGAEHARTGMPIVRALPLQFPTDTRTYTILDEYLLGDDLLVAPVVQMGQTQRTVYLPQGTWFDVWDPSQRYVGPIEITAQAPLGRPPVFSTRMRTDLAMVR